MVEYSKLMAPHICVVCNRDISDETGVMCACGHMVCNDCWLHKEEKVREVMEKLHASPQRIRVDGTMRKLGEAWRAAKADFGRDSFTHKAYEAAQDLAGETARSGIKREMEKLRLIAVFDKARGAKS